MDKCPSLGFLNISVMENQFPSFLKCSFIENQYFHFCKITHLNAAAKSNAKQIPKAYSDFLTCWGLLPIILGTLKSTAFTFVVQDSNSRSHSVVSREILAKSDLDSHSSTLINPLYIGFFSFPASLSLYSHSCFLYHSTIPSPNKWTAQIKSSSHVPGNLH